MNILNSVNSVVITTNTMTLDSSSILQAWNTLSVAFTISNTGDESLDYEILGGHESDLSDGVIIQNSATIASGAVGSYAVQIAPFSYYGVNVQSSAPGTPSEATIIGKAKG